MAKRNRDREQARSLVDASYAELVTATCAWAPCGKEFKPTSPTKNYCSGQCALAALRARDAAKDQARQAAPEDE